MAISGQQIINIGTENQITGSDNLYDAFNKIQNNFTSLFTAASPYTSFVGGTGITTTNNPISGVVTIVNNGVQSLSAGTGITLSGSTGEIIISASGNGNAGVTSVGVLSNTLSVSATPIVSAGNITINLPLIPPTESFAAGNYIAPTVTVDGYGRITAIANTASQGTVTSIALTAVGQGLSITGSPITSDGIIELTNTGVTRINAGMGIEVSGTTGELTISSTNINQGTVTRIDVSSNNLTVTGSPITSTGNITVNIPDDIALPGNVTANVITANSTINSTNLVITGTATIGNINAGAAVGNFTGYFNGIVGNTTPNTGLFTNVAVTGNITANYITSNNEVIGNQFTVKNAGAILMTNSANNYVALFTPPTIAANLAFVLPNTDSTRYGVMSTNGQASTLGYATLGWKTIVTQYVSVLLRTAATISVPPTVARRAQPVLTRTGSYVNVTLI